MEPLALSALWIFLFITVVFCIALMRRDNSVMDIFYGLIFVDVALTSFLFISDRSVVPALVTFLTVVWGIRLSARIFLKNRGKGEDRRYAAWRDAWMKRGRLYFILRSYLQVFLLQGLVIWVVSIPIVLVNSAATLPFNALVWIGLALWIVGFFFEAVADFQLDQFLRNPENRGRIMTQGLFRFSRRPNYFGESLMWWGMATIAFAEPLHWIAYVSPALITYVVVAVTGPITEKLWEGNAEYNAYKKTTSYFIPWIPNARKSS